MKPMIILIHGLYFHGSLMKYMATQLEKLGYEVHCFSYKTVSQNMDDNVISLGEFVKTKLANSQSTNGATPVVHFVGHSLGGILIRKANVVFPQLFTGRAVTLGTPHNGSAVARIAQNMHHQILGGSYHYSLDGNLPDWPDHTPLGSIAGGLCMGIGQIFKQLDKPNDGTVSVTETQLNNQTDHIILPISHTALIYSKRAFTQVDHFLKHGKFDHNAVK